MHQLFKVHVFLSFAILLFVSGCAVNPVTGQQQLMLVSEQQESQLGVKTDKSVIEQYGVYADNQLQGYMQGIGNMMGRLSHRPGLNWSFKVMDTPVVNAFAAPGGYIYVTRGLLAAVNNEAELAAVLGHEIGHVTARHSAQQYSNMMLATLGLSLGQSLLGSYGDIMGPIMETGAGLLFLKFSRDDEREADALGVEYASRAGYDAGRMADFFITLQRQSTLDGQDSARLPEFFSTHPNPVNREANVRAMAKEWQVKSAHRDFLVN
ncbi:MAG: M48 family metalloprotease, partial [Gammaproteobacteria bacterium]|nr:M48 family metalloprotease [Gammaproteobacteria bacterium]